MGEATHGTREFFQYKHEMMRYLAEELGYRIFAIEGSMPEAIAVDRFVRFGEGDPAQAIGAMGFWTWNTEEVLEMVLWMREFNKNRSPEDQIRFVGVDMQSQKTACRDLAEFLEKYAPNPQEELISGLKPFEETYLSFVSKEEQAEFLVLATQVRDYIHANQAHWTQKVSEDEWQWIRMETEVLWQVAHYPGESMNRTYRDSCMAHNLVDYLEQAGQDAKAFFWGHNGHIKKYEDSLYGGFRTCGRFLEAEYGEQYLAIGFDFGSGEFVAGGKNGLKVNFHENQSKKGQVALGEEKGCDRFFLDLRSAEKDGNCSEVLNELSPLVSIGSNYDKLYRRNNHEKAPPHHFYDAVIFISEVTAAKQLRGTASSYGALRQKWKAKKLKGDRFRLSAKARVIASAFGGNGYLQVIQSNPEKFRNPSLIKSAKVNSENEWTSLVAEGELEPKSTSIIFEFRIQGSIEVELSEMELEIQRDGKWQVFLLANADFKEWEGPLPQGWETNRQDLDILQSDSSKEVTEPIVLIHWKDHKIPVNR